MLTRAALLLAVGTAAFLVGFVGAVRIADTLPPAPVAVALR